MGKWDEVTKRVSARLDEDKAVSVEWMMMELGLPRDEACRYLALAFNAGKIAPVDKAWWCRPDNSLRTKGTTSQPDIALEVRFFEKWMRQQPVQAFTVWEVKNELQWSDKSVRRTLELLRSEGVLVKRKASMGGAFGNKPWIYGVSYEEIDKRESTYADEAAERHSQHRAKLSQAAKQRAARDKGDPHAEWADLPADVRSVAEGLIRTGGDAEAYVTAWRSRS